MTRLPARLIGLVLGLLICATPAALAQDDPRFALVTSFPSPTVSIQWEVSERFAIRVEGSYTYHAESSELSESSQPFGGATEHVYLDGTTSPVIFTGSSVIVGDYRSESTAHGGSIGLAGIVTLHRSEQLRLYVAPRIAVSLTRQQITSTLPPLIGLSPVPPDRTPSTDTIKYSSTSPGAGVSFGAATNVHRRLALFGEAGFTYFRSNIPPVGTVSRLDSISDFNVKSSTVTTRAVGGVMIFF